MRENNELFRLDAIAETSRRWRWQIYEGERLFMQSEAVYATRGDANRAGMRDWRLIAEIERPLFHSWEMLYAA